jgi:hypothetical protein
MPLDATPNRDHPGPDAPVPNVWPGGGGERVSPGRFGGQVALVSGVGPPARHRAGHRAAPCGRRRTGWKLAHRRITAG